MERQRGAGNLVPATADTQNDMVPFRAPRTRRCPQINGAIELMSGRTENDRLMEVTWEYRHGGDGGSAPATLMMGYEDGMP